MYRSYKRFNNFSFFKSVNNSIHRYLKNAVCIRSFRGNYSVLFVPLGYVNTISRNAFKARSQIYVNKHNRTCEMCYILFLSYFSVKKSDHDVNKTDSLISGVISIIIQTKRSCPNKIWVIYFCPNCVNLLP